MPDTLTRTSESWDSLDEIKFADEEALVADILRSLPLDERARTAAVRRGRELVEAARAAEGDPDDRHDRPDDLGRLLGDAARRMKRRRWIAPPS